MRNNERATHNYEPMKRGISKTDVHVYEYMKFDLGLQYSNAQHVMMQIVADRRLDEYTRTTNIPFSANMTFYLILGVTGNINVRDQNTVPMFFQ